MQTVPPLIPAILIAGGLLAGAAGGIALTSSGAPICYSASDVLAIVASGGEG